jgi:hypothetical protein
MRDGTGLSRRESPVPRPAFTPDRYEGIRAPSHDPAMKARPTFRAAGLKGLSNG